MTRHRLLRRLTLAGLALASFLSLPALAADDYPQRPIRLIIPYPPGGSLDPIGRVLAEELSQRVKQPVVVENVAGANGMVGSTRVVKSPADGYTLLLGITSNVALVPLVTPNSPYQASDLDAIGMVGTSGLVLVGKPDLPVDSLQALLTEARARPGGFSYGVPGSGSLYHLVMEAIKADTGTDIVAVPYRGAGQASVDIMGGQIDLALLGLPAMLPHIASGKMKALAVMSRERDIGNTDIPAAAETPELKSVDYTIWTGLFAPKGLPVPVRERLHGELQAVLASPEVTQDSEKLRHDVQRTQLKID